MTRTKRRKKTAARTSAQNTIARVETRVEPVRAARRPALSFGSPGQQNLIFSSMVALGFWGLAIFCVFFFAADPDHYLYGGIMALTALGWSILVARKWSAYRQAARA